MASFTDNLDGTVGDLLSSRTGWSRTIGADDAKVVVTGSGIALTAGATNASATWHRPTSQPAGNDQYIEAFLGALNNAFPFGLRCDTSTATGGGYLLRVNNSNVIEMYRRTSLGVLFSIGTYTVPTPSDLLTNKVRFEVSGDQLTAYFKGAVVIGPVTRTDFASGSIAMLSRAGTASTTTYTVDDWDSGDISAGAQALDPSLITNTQTFYAPTVAAGALTLTPALFTNSATFYAANVAPGSVSISPPLLGDGDVFYSATITLGFLLAPSLLANSASFYASTVTPGDVSLAPPLDANSNAFFAATVTAVGGSQSLAPAVVSNVVSIFAPVVSAGNDDEQYPLAGIPQPYPMTATQGYPLAGITQTYPLARAA